MLYTTNPLTFPDSNKPQTNSKNLTGIRIEPSPVHTL